jgi:putative DNA primase/helicase
MLSDLAASGLEPADMHAWEPDHVTDEADAMYGIPYWDLDGRPIVTKDGYPLMYRIKRRLSARGEAAGAGKYSQPASTDIGSLATVPYVNPLFFRLGGDRVLICEGEKKAVAAMKYLGLPAIGIGGCYNWRARRGANEVHPWILRLVTGKRVTIVPDGDVGRYDISRAYGSLVTELQHLGVEVALLRPTGKIDDLLVASVDPLKTFEEIPAVSSFVEDPKRLCERYGLAYKQNKVGITVLPNESNVLTLVRHHPGFPKIWLNLDRNTVMIDDKATTEGKEDIDLLTYLQHNLGLTNCAPGTLRSVMRRVSLDNAVSPFEEYLSSLKWDGTPRLENLFVHYGTANDTPVAREAGLKWLTAAVARTRVPGCPLDYIVIANGPQGIGKSSFPKILFGEDMVVDVIGAETNTRDMLAKFHFGKCANFEELASMTTRDIAHLNALITARTDVYRPPYGRDMVENKRRFVLYGSTNRLEFLPADLSGHRRFAVVEMTAVRFDDLTRDRDQLWAEAVVRFEEGGQYTNIFSASGAAKRYVVDDGYVAAFEASVADGTIGLNLPIPVVNGHHMLTLEQVRTMAGIGADRNPSTYEMRSMREHLVLTGWTHKETWVNDPRTGKQIRRVWIRGV